MAGIKIPGTAGQAKERADRLSAAVRWHLNLAMAPPEQKARPPSAGDLGKRLQTARLALMSRPNNRAV